MHFYKTPIILKILASSVYAVSMDTVTVPDVPPPEIPVPAVTPKMSPLPTQADQS